MRAEEASSIGEKKILPGSTEEKFETEWQTPRSKPLAGDGNIHSTGLAQWHYKVFETLNQYSIQNNTQSQKNTPVAPVVEVGQFNKKTSRAQKMHDLIWLSISFGERDKRKNLHQETSETKEENLQRQYKIVSC